MKSKLNSYQKQQLKVIQKIKKVLKNKKVPFSTVAPVKNFGNDKRICLTGAFLPEDKFKKQVDLEILQPLKKIEPEHFYYPRSSLHLTIKNIRIINHPPHFDKNDKKIADKVFSKIVPKHKSHYIYFDRLFLFHVNLALIGTSDKERDHLILDLDQALQKAGLPDDKKYINKKYFFGNMTLARFTKPPSQKFINKIEILSRKIKFAPLRVNKVSLITCNAVLKKLKIINEYLLLP